MWRSLAGRGRPLLRHAFDRSLRIGSTALHLQVNARTASLSIPSRNRWRPQFSASLCSTGAHSNGSNPASPTEHAPAAEAQQEEIVRLPLPPGVSGDKFGLYEIADSGKDWGDVSGSNAVVAVHGAEELWVPDGSRNEGAGGGVFAVIGASGTQYKVVPGDVLYTVRRDGDVNDVVRLDHVLVVGAYDWTVFGRPLIRGACVTAVIEEQTLSAKVIVAKFKKRKGYRRRSGHRQPITRMRILDVEFEFPEADKIVPHEVEFDPRRPPRANHERGF